MAGDVQTVRSADGTAIAFERDETDPAGPALVLVLGAFSDRTSGAALGLALRRRFSVYRYDRRGRGDSGDTPPWAIAREIEDLAAVVAATGESPFVYGHSSGAALALEAAAAGVAMRRLVVYEPPYPGEAAGPESWAAEIDAFVADGRPDLAVERFLRGTGAPPQAIARTRESAIWPALVALAPTLVHDVMISGSGAAPISRIEQIAVPVLAGFGGMSPDWAPRAADAIAAAAPDGRTHLFEGQAHGASVAALLPVLTAFFGQRPA